MATTAMSFQSKIWVTNLKIVFQMVATCDVFSDIVAAILAVYIIKTALSKDGNQLFRQVLHAI